MRTANCDLIPESSRESVLRDVASLVALDEAGADVETREALKEMGRRYAVVAIARVFQELRIDAAWEIKQHYRIVKGKGVSVALKQKSLAAIASIRSAVLGGGPRPRSGPGGVKVMRGGVPGVKVMRGGAPDDRVKMERRIVDRMGSEFFDEAESVDCDLAEGGLVVSEQG